MKEITRIHLAKTPFEIEIAAQKDIERYLSEIARQMQADDDAMYEIEARMVEILQDQGVKSGGVITGADVAAIKSVLGDSTDFSDDDAVREPEADSTKKLMRDLDNAWVGGVGAGIAAYLGIDVLIVRLAMVILAVVSFGTLLFIYMLLWLLVPAAKTAADKLRMRGQPVTLDTLKTVSDAGDGRTPAGRVVSLVLRSIVAVGLGFVAFGALLATVMGGFGGLTIVPLFSGTIQLWSTVLLVALIVGGLALTTLFAALAYGVASLRLAKPAVIGVIASLVIGLLTIPVIAVSVPQVAYEVDRTSTQTKTIDLSADQAQGIESVRVDAGGPVMIAGPIQYGADKNFVKLTYREAFVGSNPSVNLHREGSELVVVIDDIDTSRCGTSFIATDFCRDNGIARVEVYRTSETSTSQLR